MSEDENNEIITKTDELGDNYSSKKINLELIFNTYDEEILGENIEKMILEVLNDKAFDDIGWFESSSAGDKKTMKNNEIISPINKEILKEDYKNATETYTNIIHNLQEEIKTLRSDEKYKKLEKELRECEKFRHNIFKKIGEINNDTEKHSDNIRSYTETKQNIQNNTQ